MAKNKVKRGVPPKEFSMSHILRQIAAQPWNETGKSAKELIGLKLIEQAISGDFQSQKYIYDRLDGAPTQAIKDVTERPILIDQVYSILLEKKG